MTKFVQVIKIYYSDSNFTIFEFKFGAIFKMSDEDLS